MYDLYVLESSPACTKVRAMLRYKKIPFRAHAETLSNRYRVLRRRTGQTRVPVLATPAFALADPSRIARYLEEEHPVPPLHDADPRRAALGRLLGHLADEWVGRLLLVVRWTDRAASRDHARRIASELASEQPFLLPALSRALPLFVRPVLWVEGARSANRPALVGSLRALLGTVEAILAVSRYLLSARPTLADFALYGPLAQMREDAAGRALLPGPHGSLARWLGDMDQVAAGASPGAEGTAAPLASYAPLVHLHAGTWLRVAIAAAEALRAHAREIEVATVHGPFRVRASGRLEGCLKDDLAVLEGVLTRAGSLLDDDRLEAPLWRELARLPRGPARELLRPFPRLRERLTRA